jgi:hypothetical protein
MASPRETSLVVWVSEGEGSRFKASKFRIGFPSQITANMIVRRRRVPLEGTCLRDKTKELERAAVVNTSQFNDYLQIYMSNDQM